MKFGIIGAMDVEIDNILSSTDKYTQTSIANRIFYSTKIGINETVVVKSGVGLVNAAITSQILIDKFNVDIIINTGVAGSIHPHLNVYDIVIATDCLEYEMDATIFGYEKGQIPGINTYSFPSDIPMLNLVKSFEDKSIYFGRVLSSDKFCSDKSYKKYLFDTFNGYCVEMEGASIAHVCYENNIKFLVIRCISDSYDTDYQIEYSEFEKKAANLCSNLILKILNNYSQQ